MHGKFFNTILSRGYPVVLSKGIFYMLFIACICISQITQDASYVSASIYRVLATDLLVLSSISLKHVLNQ